MPIFQPNRFNLSLLGGGIPGGQPRWGLIGGGAGVNGGSGMEGGSSRSTDRTILRRAMNNAYPINAVITPFRASLNAGDIAGTVHSNPSNLSPGSNQVTSARIATQQRAFFGGVHNDGGSYYSGNSRYVYDSSDYVRYKKLIAENKTYNDLSFGGDNSNGSYVARRNVRRF
uniref:Uncharacterized protein n=1 Tax=viral metagenome TaxID=1070528 RepID=A0A6C0IIA1_9ZZZZ